MDKLFKNFFLGFFFSIPTHTQFLVAPKGPKTGAIWAFFKIHTLLFFFFYFWAFLNIYVYYIRMKLNFKNVCVLKIYLYY